MLGRELLLMTHEMVDLEHGERNARILLNAAAATFLWGVIDPMPAEYPIDGPEFGRLDALMWFGICASLFVPVDAVFDSDDLPDRPAFMRSSSDPQAIEIASRGFETLGDLNKAGRCAEEFGEVVKFERSSQEASIHFMRAADLFGRIPEPRRAEIARSRIVAKDVPTSPFFHRQPGSFASTTISGSREFDHLRSKLRLG
jgi:hypothetical protein